MVPKTLVEAKAYRYGMWSGNPTGKPYLQHYCAYPIFPSLTSVIERQCSRRPGFGQDAIFCHQHAKLRITNGCHI